MSDMKVAMALKDIPPLFDVDTEEDLRLAVAKYFAELGFEANEIRAETNFTIRLGHNTLVVEGQEARQRDRVTGRSDLLLTRHGKPLAIVETKAPGHALNEKDAQQAISYARLLLEMAPYAIVTNGKETQVYDTFATTIVALETPKDAQWYRDGQRLPSVSEDIRYAAARTLIGVNAATLHLFCREQVTQSLEDIKGSPNEAKSYISEAYTPRQEVTEAFATWLTTDIPCFAVVAESGMGKTNFMCAAAEQLLMDQYFVLFYPVADLIDRIETAICDDFAWEFHRERHLAHIVERFDEIAREHGKPFVLFLEGLDQFSGKKETLKAELRDLVSRLRERSIRLCISCKSFDWGDFIIDDSRVYNRLAKAVYPLREAVTHPQVITPPDPHQVGVWLSEYSDEELEQVFARYQKVFSLKGSLQGRTRTECRVPLILRLLADVWSGRETDIPSEISQRALFDWYWNAKLSQVRHQHLAEQCLSEVARLSVESGEGQIAVSRLFTHNPSVATDETYQDLIRSGLLRAASDVAGLQKVSFGLEKLRSYVYTLKVLSWPTLLTKDVAAMICNLLSHPIGVETVEFYVRTIDRGETNLLTDIALHNICDFVRLMELLPIKSSVLDARPGNEQQRAILAHVEQYAVAYSELSRHYFFNLCEKIEPFTNEPVGLLVSPSLSTHQLRTCTPAYPQPVVVIPQEYDAAFQNGQLPPEVYQDLRPGGNIHLDIGLSTLIDQLPQKMAWERILSQVAALFVNRCLDETTSPELLEERAWEILLRHPASFWGNVPVTGNYCQVFGFQNAEDAAVVPIDELMQRTYEQIQQYMTQFNGLIVQHFQQNPGKKEPAAFRWYIKHIRLLKRLYYSLRWLRVHKQHLEVPSYTLDQLFSYLQSGSLASPVGIVEQLLPKILHTYASLARQNFPQLLDQLAFYKYLDAPMLVEVTHQPSLPYFHNDLLRIAYVALPSCNIPEKWIVYTCDEQNSVAHVRFQEKTLQGMLTETSGVQGATFGQAPISRRVGDIFIEDEHALFCFTQFPSHYPILDQVYQLLGNEMEHLLNGDFRDWNAIDNGRIENEQMDWWISQQKADLGFTH